jgi:uncharacterized protein (TIGR00255 family)
MTAFARQEQQTEQGDLIWEIRSVNHRYLELSLRLDERFRALEMPIRKLFSEQLGRGKVDAVLRYKAPEDQSTNLDIDQTLARSVVEQCELVSGFADQAAPIDPVRIL